MGDLFSRRHRFRQRREILVREEPLRSSTLQYMSEFAFSTSKERRQMPRSLSHLSDLFIR